jgi:hypothetical protein
MPELRNLTEEQRSQIWGKSLLAAMRSFKFWLYAIGFAVLSISLQHLNSIYWGDNGFISSIAGMIWLIWFVTWQPLARQHFPKYLGRHGNDE